jgi:TonB family protein
VNDAVDRVILQREAMDAGFPGSLGLSLVVHLLIVGGAVAAPYLLPHEPLLRVADGFAVPLPRGGGAPLELPAPAGAPAPPVDNPNPPAAEPPPKVLKPPTKEEPRHTKGLPELDAKKGRKLEKAPMRPAAAAPGTGAPSQTPGLAIGPPGPGVPEGTDSGGDWYLATVQQKIWMIWTQEIKVGFTQPIGVTFTILADGKLAEVHVTQPSGATLLDNAALRAIYSAAPFGPLPKDYGTNQKTIQALFKPTS